VALYSPLLPVPALVRLATATWYADDVASTTGGGGASSVAITAPAGWTQQADQTATGVRTTTFTKVAGGAEPASYAFTLSAATKAAAALSAFVGVDNTSPVDVAARQVNVSTLSHVAPSVTTTGGNRLVVVANGLATNTSLTAPSGSTELVDSAAAVGAPTVTVETSSSAAATAGATGTRTSASLVAAVSATSTVTLRPVTTGGGALVSNTVTRSQTGRMLTSTVDTLVDGFEYDTAGRLCRANLSSKTNTYRYGGTACQLVTTGTGANANRTQTDETVGGTTTSVTYGYDTADKLTTVSGQTAPSYNVRGQTLTVAGQTLTWDGADRNVTVAEGTTTVTYTRDATDRIVARTSGATVTRYGFTGGGDTPDVVMNGTGTVIEQMYPLPGGVTLTKRGAVQVWSYPNIHGDVAAVANATGVKQGATFLYDPFGQPITTAGAVSPDLVPDNADQEFDFGSLGQHQRGYEHSANITITQMGARPYLQGSGRFLSIDPVEGGTSNDYTYVDDPNNSLDIDGRYCVTGVARTVVEWRTDKNGARPHKKNICRSLSRGSGRVVRSTTYHAVQWAVATGVVAIPVACAAGVWVFGIGCVVGAGFGVAGAAGSGAIGGITGAVKGATGTKCPWLPIGSLKELIGQASRCK
jgi:large repetitive protein